MTSPSHYTPRTPTMVDHVGYTQRVVDALMRSNPLHNATVETGLVRWLGNYLDDEGQKKPIVWIGDFEPADINLPGNPPQRAISLWRDGPLTPTQSSALAIYDHYPEGGNGLRQTLHLSSIDGNRLFTESRQGGWSFPTAPIPMWGRDAGNVAGWPGTSSAAFTTIFEGRQDVVGHEVWYRFWCLPTAGAAGEYRMVIKDMSSIGDPDIVGPTHVLPAGGNLIFDDWVTIDGFRGRNVQFLWQARVTNGVGKVHSSYSHAGNVTLNI